MRYFSSCKDQCCIIHDKKSLVLAVLVVKGSLVLQVDKLTANQKLDLNLERGRLRDDLQLLRDKLTTLRTSLEREVRLL